jgi:ClpP class serine protease
LKQRGLEFLVNNQWAMTQDVLDLMHEVALRENEPDLAAIAEKAARYEALTGRDGQPMSGTANVYVHGSVAEVQVIGPVVRYATFFAAVSGMTSVEQLAKDFTAALNDPKIRAIVLNIDSPGGAVSGVAEFGSMVRAARAAKPVIAYVGNMAASGGYWIGSQADAIVVGRTGQLGSIGVVATLTKPAARAGEKRYEFVSSVSPNKRPDLETDEGRAQVQGIVDSIAAEFVAQVAEGRGVSEATVIEKFGRGGLLVGAAAVEAGMADEVAANLEDLLARLNAGQMVKRKAVVEAAAEEKRGEQAQEEDKMSDVKTPVPAAGSPVDTNAVAAAAVAAERERSKAILNLPEAKGREELALHLVTNTNLKVDDAKALLAAAPVAQAAKAPNPLEAAMAGVKNPNVGAGGADAEMTADQKEVAELKKLFAVAGVGENEKK